MARASIYTLLPLDDWAQILGISPWEFNQAQYPGPKSAQCADVMYQWPYDKDHLSREEVAEAIATAEHMLASELLYWPAPYYTIDEVIPYPRPIRRDVWGLAGTVRGEWKTIHTRWHKVISGGLFNRTLIGTISGANLKFWDKDNDGIFETFEATITDVSIGSLTDPYELALYFDSTARQGKAVGETWRIRPLDVSISGNTATISGSSTLLIDPNLQSVVSPQILDASDSTIYVTVVECYRTFTDATATSAKPYQGVAIWKDDPACTQDCDFQIIPLCLGQHQNDQGQIFASFGDPNTWPYPYREPDRLQVSYAAGVPLVNGRMDTDYARMVAYLSVSLLAHEKCGCDRSNRIIAYWRDPVTKFVDSLAKATSYAEPNGPFPMTRGGQYAWIRCQKQRHVEVVSIG